MRLERCEWNAALADATESLGMPARSGVAVAPALVALGRILSARDDAEALSRLDEAAGYAYNTGELQRICPVAAARAEYFLLAGEPARAEAEARTGLALAQSKSHLWFSGELAYRLWQATGVVEPLPALPEPYRLMLQHGDRLGAASHFARLGRGYARIEALSHGHPEAAGEALGALDALGAVRAARTPRGNWRCSGCSRGDWPTWTSPIGWRCHPGRSNTTCRPCSANSEWRHTARPSPPRT